MALSLTALRRNARVQFSLLLPRLASNLSRPLGHYIFLESRKFLLRNIFRCFKGITWNNLCTPVLYPQYEHFPASPGLFQRPLRFLQTACRRTALRQHEAAQMKIVGPGFRVQGSGLSWGLGLGAPSDVGIPATDISPCLRSSVSPGSLLEEESWPSWDLGDLGGLGGF